MKTFLWDDIFIVLTLVTRDFLHSFSIATSTCLCSDNHSLAQLIYFCHLMSSVVYFYIHVCALFLHPFSFISSPFLFTVTTLSTPVSEITTLSLQSNTNVPLFSHSTTSSSLSGDIDATTTFSEQRTEESLKVLPLTANKTVVDRDDSVTVTQSTSPPMTVNLSDTKNQPEIIRIGETLKEFEAHQPQTELEAGDEMNEKSRSNQDKEGRAINFPLEIASNNQSSTAPGHMPGSVNFVTTSTEKAHVMSFFDLSDVSMDHDDNEHREMEKKSMETTTVRQTAGPGILTECSFNGTSYKVCWIRFLNNCNQLFDLKAERYFQSWAESRVPLIVNCPYKPQEHSVILRFNPYLFN